MGVGPRQLLFRSPLWASTQLCQADLLVFMKAPASSCCGLVRTMGRLQGSSREWGYPVEEQSGVHWDCSTFLLAWGGGVWLLGGGLHRDFWICYFVSQNSARKALIL